MIMNKIIILIIVLLVAGGIYFFFFSSREQEPTPSAVEEATAIAEVSTSNTVPVIEQEVQATDLDNLDKEFTDIEAEIETALGEAQ